MDHPAGGIEVGHYTHLRKEWFFLYTHSVGFNTHKMGIPEGSSWIVVKLIICNSLEFRNKNKKLTDAGGVRHASCFNI